jgi:hypothetical protein
MVIGPPPHVKPERVSPSILQQMLNFMLSIYKSCLLPSSLHEWSLYSECLSCLHAEISSPTSQPFTSEIFFLIQALKGCLVVMPASLTLAALKAIRACSFRRYEKLSSIYGASKDCVAPESRVTIPPFGSIERNKWFDHISSQ